MNPVIGIDLGTTFSAIAILDDSGRPVIVPVDGERIMASCVYAPKADLKSIVVGAEARNSLDHEPESVVKRFKRDMGTDTIYHLRSGLDLSPIDASAAILRKLVQEAGKEHGPITEVVITVPANFAERQRKATIEAGELAGLKVTNIINEPTAAVLAYAAQKSVKGTIMIYDLGGGTFDVTIAKVDGDNIEILTSDGSSELGGMDFDQKIADIIDQKHLEKFGRSLRDAAGLRSDEDERRSVVWQALLRKAEECKKTLSKMATVPVRFSESPDGPLQVEVTRDEFEQAISALIAKTEMRVDTALESLNMVYSDIDEVLLVGGSSRVPAVKASLKRMFGREPSEAVNLDEAVALGAAIYAGLRANPGNLKPLQREKLKSVSVSDVANHFYGTIAHFEDETRGSLEERVAIIIPKNTPIPCSKSETFYTVADGQRAVRCRVTQSSDNETDPDFVNIIKESELALPPNRPAGQPVEITYSYDQNQTMHVMFRDVNSGGVFKDTLKLDPQARVATRIPDFTID